MCINSEKELLGLLKIGRVVGLTLRTMQSAVEPGMTTLELDRIGAKVFADHGARSAPEITYGFPGATCISINNEAAHGIPGERVIQPGDVVKIDVSAELEGYFADAAVTVLVPPTTTLKEKLYACAQAAFEKGIAAARTGKPINGIGQAVQAETRRRGFSVICELPGHGVGRGLHEAPSVPNCYVRRLNQPLQHGQVITIEPHISVKPARLLHDPDGWTLKTSNTSLAAEYEHTVVVMRDQALIVTAMV